MKHIITAILLIIPFISLKAGNFLTVSSGEVAPGEIIMVEVSIDNTDNFIAFQLDIHLPYQFSFVLGSAGLNPDRITNHSLSASIVNGSILRIISYSLTNQPFVGNSGAVMHFELTAGVVPGDYLLEPVNAIIGGTGGGNLLTSTTPGVVTILGPDIRVSPETLDFGEIPLESYHDLSLYVTNAGNLDLEVSAVTFDSPWFSILRFNAFTIPPGGSQDFTVRFQAQEAGIFHQEMIIHSNDPETPGKIIAVQAAAFAVNELHAGNMLSFSGETDTLRFTINNMEAFVAFQFDLQLPQPLSFIPGSAILSDRKTDHMVAADIINGNIVRVVALSNSNQAFQGSDGHILDLAFEVFGTGGWYPLTVSNVIISDQFGNNILSDFYSGLLEVAAADIFCQRTLDFGDVSVLDTIQKSLAISNNGTDVLIIDEILTNNSTFFVGGETPIILEPGETHPLQLYFHSFEKGHHEATLSIFSNDPDENPFDVQLNAFAFSPNFMYVEDAGAFMQDTLFVEISVDNHELFTAFEFKLHYPDHILSFLPAETYTHLTERAQDHEVYAGLIQDGKLLVFAYSMQKQPFTGNSGPVIRIGFLVNASSDDSNYPLFLSECILSDANGENILYNNLDGTLHILEQIVCPDNQEFCFDAEASVLAGATPEGGIYSGNGVTNGLFDPSQAGAGIHTITYTVAYDQGFIRSCNFFFTVLPLPEVSLADFESICLDSSPIELTGGLPEGGQFSGPGIDSDGWFDPQIAGDGIHQIIYSFIDGNGCSDIATALITVHLLPQVVCMSDFSVTINSDPFILSGANPEGGIYSGAGVDDGGIFYPLVAGEGVHTIYYTYTDANSGCTNYCNFEITVFNIFTILATSGENGSISPEGTIEVIEGDSQLFSIVPDEGYHVEEVLVDGFSVGSVTSYLFTEVMDDHSIQASFAINTYVISSSSGEGGYIDPEGDIVVMYGEDQFFSIIADTASGYEVLDVLVDGESQGAITAYTFENVMEHHSIEAIFGLRTYVISAIAGENGSIDPSGNIVVDHGDSQLFIVVPDEGYHIEEVLVDGFSVGSVTSYLFTEVMDDHSIHASFAINTYVISSSSGEGGYIDPEGDIVVMYGEDQFFSIIADTASGYEVLDVLVDGESQGAITAYAFENVMEHHSIEAIFGLRTYVISAIAGENGSIDPSGNIVVNHGDSQLFSVVPDEGYHIEEVLVDGFSVGSVTSYLFTEVMDDHSIQASFAINTYVISSSSGEGGYIDPEGDIVVMYGEDQFFSIIADTASGYEVLDVLVDGESQGAITAYTFENVMEHHSIEAIFGLRTYVISAIAGENGSIDPSGNIVVNHGDSQLFSVVPDEGYVIHDLLVNGHSVGAINEYEFVYVTDNQTIEAEFELKDETMITNPVARVIFYPNPFDKTVTINNAKGLKKVVIKNIYGHTVFEKNSEGTTDATITTELFKPGVYIFIFTSVDDSVKAVKMIKKQ